MVSDRVRVILDNWASLYADNIRKELSSESFVNTGKLLNSIDYDLVEKGSIITFDIKSANYLGILNQGIPKGKRVNQSRLIEWIKSKGIPPRDKKGRFKKHTENNYKKLAFVISRSMQKEGVIKRFDYKGSHLLERFQDRLQAEFTPQLVEAIELDLKEQINKVFNGKG